MLKKTGKRLLSLILAAMIIVSTFSVQTFVMGMSEEDRKEIESFFGIDESNPLWHTVVEMDSVLLRYLGKSDASEIEIAGAISKMDFETLQYAEEDIKAVTDLVKDLSQEEQILLFETSIAKTFGDFNSAIESVSTLGTNASKTVSVLDGKVMITDSQGTGSVSGSTVTVNVKGGLVSGKTNTVDIYNNTDEIATISFNYEASNYDSFSESRASGAYSAVLYPDSNITFTIKSKAAYQTATLILSDIKYVAAAAQSNVAVDYISSLGSVTVNGKAVAPDEVTVATLTEGATLVATPANGSNFIGWVNASNDYILSTSTTYKFTPVADTTIKAVFTGKTAEAYFTAGDSSYLFSDLTKAANHAATTGNKTVKLINDGVLSAGNYTIPSGVTLLIPFDDAGTVYTTTPAYVEGDTRTTPTAFRTLTMASGANITVNGTLALPAKHYPAKGSRANGGSPDGPCSFIKMESGSNITVSNGANLYAYGFIIGDGTVIAKNGASVYEYFQIMDFRGGSQTTDMKNGVFPLSQYYIQNIEVPLTLEAGSTESCYTSMTISGMTVGSGITFIAKSGAMFNHSSGTVTKRYDPATDRLVVDLNGEMSISPIEMEIGSGLLSTKINSKNYELPINGNITVNVNGGSITLAQDVAMLPGAEINIAEGAKCVIGSNTNVYVYDADQWGTFCGSTNKKLIPVQYAPGRKYTRTEKDIKDASIRVDGTLDASNGYLYTSAGGANIYGTASGKAVIKAGTQSVTHQLVQNTGYTEIPLTPAKLKNADGTYVSTASGTATYYYINNVWVNHTNGHIYTEEIVSVADCETAGVKKFTCPCGYSYTETSPALGHNPGASVTCTEDQVCLTCGKILVASVGHTYNSVKTNPDCTNGGYTTYTCSKCGDSYVSDKVPALGHAPGSSATCTKAQICTVCGVELTAALGHNYTSEIKAPDCTHAGYTLHTCLNCGDSYKDNEISALGHTPGADATCTQAQVCTVCGEVLKSENGHVPGIAATCTDAQICDVCGEVLVPALGHDIVYEDAVDSTCTKDGYSAGSHCSRCDYTEGKTIIPAKGHTPGYEATCTTNQICTVCYEELRAPLGHNYEETVVNATCLEGGYIAVTCSGCGDSYIKEEMPATGHTPAEEANCEQAQVCSGCGIILAQAKGHTPGADATCTEAQICTDCGEELVPALGHTPGKKATCKNAQTCTVCGEELAPVLEHRFVENRTDATCTENGSVSYTCSRCRYTYFDSEIEATGHNMSAGTCTEPSRCLNANCDYTEGESFDHTIVIDEEMPAFCEQDGLTEGSHCSVCGTVIVEQEIIPALGHNITQHPAKAPTFTSVGWEAYEDCSRCGYSTYVEIPKLDVPAVSDYETFLENLELLEELAVTYAAEVPGKDPLQLIIKYIRTGVDRYNEGSWGIMAGYEDTGFAEYVAKVEDTFNSVAAEGEQITVSGLKNIELFDIPNGNTVDFGHMFGTMDITYHNKGSQGHADVGGWTGDLVDLIEFSDYGGVTGTLDEMIAEIGTNYLLQDDPEEVGGFNQQDMYGDMDSLYLMNVLTSTVYEQGAVTALFREYFTENLSMETRADYFLRNRLGGVSTRADVRNSVYNIYTSNRLITTLEGTKEFNTQDISLLRKASCYAFADYICKLAGDYVEVTENPYFTVFESEQTTLAPGVIQHTKKATSADNKQMVYYTATADLTRDDVHVFANYKNNDPTQWGMQPVLTQANAAQEKYGNPESEHYIENYNVIASINGDGFNMGTGEPGGLLVMNGKEYHSIHPSNGFFGILEDGTPVIGTTQEYNTIYKDRVKEGIGGFGSMLITDGEINITQTTNYYSSRASRTAVGITRTGKVVFMVLDGRQEPISCGGSMIEIAQIMFDAGCVQAINLDGGGSTTYVAKLEGDDKLSVASRPSDGAARSVSTSLMIVSTAPSSTAFHHAIIESETDYLTKGASVQLTAAGVSATGNSAELPEGTTWAVSDEKWGTITENGVFTGLRNGTVEVYVMLGDEILGKKTMNIVVPDRVYFTKNNIDVIYGIKSELPVVALYESKPVTVLYEDIVLTVNNPAAGVIDGFGFIATEGTGIKNGVITAALAADPSKTASINVALYNEGDISFDFDKATGGDRVFAWLRTVSNSTTEDNLVYNIRNTDEPMITDYTFAIDMTQIPIPDRLAELTTMLPGAELEGASAWTFLLQLAERVSVLTEVKPTVKVDDDFIVDYSEVTLINDYFELNGIDYDEEKNTLTMTLNWIDQTQSIDAETANPLCILKGIKLIPKDDANWSKDRLEAINEGEISYNVYMRASALYAFANKSENQKAYGIYPFINPNDENEKGGYFGNVYAQFKDSYTLSKAVKDGWVNEEGGFAYYADGERYTGIKLIDGYYYDFGENGINEGQNKYTGVFYDEVYDVYRYAKIGELVSGWHQIGEDWYYFHADTMAAKPGYYQVGAVSYNFEATGKITSGVWVKCVLGYRYYYGPSYYRTGWEVIDGNRYYFEDSYRYEGYRRVTESNSQDYYWYDFGTDGICKDEVIPDGIYDDAGKGICYVKDGLSQKGIYKIDGDYYLFYYDAYAKSGKGYAFETHCDLPIGVYYFGEDYKMLNGIVEEADGIYYYSTGKPKTVGLVEYNGDYYFVGEPDGKVVVNKRAYVWETNGYFPEGYYEFGPDGKMLNGIVEKDGVLYHYVNGRPSKSGLVLVGDEYYHVSGENGEITVDNKVWTGNETLPEANYSFGPDGKMLDGIVEIDGVLCYYSNGRPSQAGLIKIGNDYYFADGVNGELAVDKKHYVWKPNSLLPEGHYEFGPDGKMLDGIVEKDGVLYYYETGRGVQAGLVKIGDDYYFAGGANGELTVNKKYYIWQSNGLLPESNYVFGADGKMLDGIVEKEDGLYAYDTGKILDPGLHFIDGAYYFVEDANGKLSVNKKKYAWETHGLLPESTYEYGPDGKMLDGIVEKDGVLYYYNTGKAGPVGLVKIGDDYYFAGGSNGELAVNKTQYAWETNGLLPEKNYDYDENGKMYNGFFERDGIKYYYINGRPAPVGLNYVDGYYYFVKYDGSLIVNQSYYVWETNGLSVEMTYTFNENGQIIG